MPNDLNEPKASAPKVSYHLRRLRKLFSRASDHQFLEMVWAADALRAGRPETASHLLSFPRGALNQSLGSQYAVHQWELETLLVQLFLASGNSSTSGTVFDCKSFASIAHLINTLRKLEDAEASTYLRNSEFNIFGEMHRIAQRQFHWQRGYFNLPQLYRYAYIYAQGKCGEYFERVHGFPIAELNFVGVALFLQSATMPWISKAFAVPELGLTPELVKQALPLLHISLDAARDATRKMIDEVNAKHGRPIPTAFLPSILRRYPLIGLADNASNFTIPIQDVLLMRVTSGLYYDIIGGGQKLLNDANDRFEQYCAMHLESLLPRFKVSRAYRFEPQKGKLVDTPDLLVRDSGKIAVVAECKATKLTYLAQFAEDPFEAERKQYIQIANGVLQLWRFFSFVRRGIVKENIEADTSAIVITLDSFLMLNRELRAKIIEEANSLADSEEEISAEDRRHVLFCPIADLEAVLSVSTEDTFLAALRSARNEKYAGWGLREVAQEESKERMKIEQKKFAFRLDGLLPWWDRLGEFKRAKK